MKDKAMFNNAASTAIKDAEKFIAFMEECDMNEQGIWNAISGVKMFEENGDMGL